MNILESQYTIINKIGEGANGHIYKAIQNSTGQQVVIKTIKFNDDYDIHKKKQEISRFETETHLCAEINHPNIVKIIDKGYLNENEPFAILEYISGVTLKDYILKNHDLSIETTSQIMLQVLEALVYSHRLGIVHRDLKPRNIMISDHDIKLHVKILDFGISAFLKEHSTIDLDMLGTPSYCAPEQLLGILPTHKSDIYAWGLIFLECLTGKPIVSGTCNSEIIEKQLSTDEIHIPAEIALHPLGALLRKALYKSPDKRFKNTLDLYREYQTIDFSSLKNIFLNFDLLTPKNDFTVANTEFFMNKSTRKQLTVLCIEFAINKTSNFKLDDEIADILQIDLVTLCKESINKYNGYIANSFINRQIVYFGYPQSDGTDLRKAGKAALELIINLQKQSFILQKTHNVKLDIRICLHAGNALIQRNQVPDGIFVKSAIELLNFSSFDTISVSESTKKTLELYFNLEVIEVVKSITENKLITLYKLLGERQTETLLLENSSKNEKKIIGRDEEKKCLLHAWFDLLNGNSKCFVIKGLAGIGKSKLIGEVLKEIHKSEKSVIFECHCYPEYQNDALYPFLSLLKNVWGLNDYTNVYETIKDHLQNAQCNLAEAFPLLCMWMALKLPNDYALAINDPREQKKILFKTIKQCLLQQTKPVVIVVEDLHWSDSISKEFIEYLLVENNFLIFLTSRLEWENTIAIQNLTEITLTPLNESSAKDLIIGTLGGIPVHETVIQYIINRSDSIPLFIEELTNMLLEQQSLIIDNGIYKLKGNFTSQEVPFTLQSLLNARLDKIGFARETAQIASAIGREFNYELLIATSGKHEIEIQNDINQLLRSEIIYKQLHILGERYVFRHTLLQDAAYQSMPSNFKKEIHNRIAIAMLFFVPESFNEQPFHVGIHLAKAGRFDESIKYGIQEIEILISKTQYIDALQTITTVKQWIAFTEESFQSRYNTIKVNSLLLPVLLNTEGFGSIKFFDVCGENAKLIALLKSTNSIELSSSINNISVITSCFLLMHFHVSGQRNKAWLLVDDLLFHINDIDDYKTRLMTLATIGQMYLCEGLFQPAEDILQSVIDEGISRKDYTLFQQYGFDPIMMSYGNLACVLYLKGMHDNAIECTNKGFEYSLNIQSPNDIVVAFVFKGLILALLSEKELLQRLLVLFKLEYKSQLKKSWASCFFTFIEDWSNTTTTNSLAIRSALIQSNQDAVLNWYELLLIDTLNNQKQYEHSFEILKDIEARITKNNETCLLSIVYTMMANYNAYIGNETESCRLYSIATEISKKQSSAFLTGYSQTNKKQFYQ